MENELTCKLCNYYFTEPVILSCNDCICYTCLLNHLELNPTQQSNFDTTNQFKSKSLSDKNKFECPVCNQSIVLPIGNINGLPRYTIVEPIIQNLTKRNDVNQVECTFCEDYSKQQATLKCVQCNFNYCGNCFDTFHISRGPLAKHEIVEPFKEEEISSQNLCYNHSNEKKKIFCLTCGVCICFLCKEVGEHHGHDTKIVASYQQIEKQLLTEEIDRLTRLDDKLSTCLQESDDFSLFVKKVGLESEAHVIRECDQLIAIIQARKQYHLEVISQKFNNIVDDISNHTEVLTKEQESLSCLSDILMHTTESDDHIAVLEASNLLKIKSREVFTETNNEISMTRKLFTITPFDGMVLDFYQLKKDLYNISWLKPPGAPKFRADKCFVQNNTAHVKWEGSKGRIGSYYLEKSNDREKYEMVYEGKECSMNVYIEYNEEVYFRVYAMNGAGYGDYSRELLLKAPAGLQLNIDENKTSEEVNKKEDGCTFSCSYTNKPLYIYGDVSLIDGRHYWKYRMNELSLKHSMEGVIAIGLENQDLLESENHHKYEVYINMATQYIEKNKKNKIHIHRKAEDVRNYDFTFLLDLYENFFDIYLNGVLVLKDANQLHTFNELKQKNFTPYIMMEKCKLNMSIIDDIDVPLAVPERPTFDTSNCYTENIDILYEWFEDSITTDTYLLEVYHSIDEEESIIAYRGNHNSFTYTANKYEEIIYARLYAVNVIGKSKCSDLLTMKTSKGLSFAINDNEKDVNLQLWSSNRSVKYSFPEPLLLFGDVAFKNGIHFWKLSVEQFEGKSSRLGFGLAQSNVKCVDFGARDSYCIMLTSHEIDESPMYTINTCLRRKQILHSDIACLFDLERRRFYSYLNGMLITRPVQDDLLLNIPRSIWSFSSIKMGMHPAFLIEGNIKFSIICDQPMPKPPGQPTFGDCVCENISCKFSWNVCDEIGSYTNYFILKVCVTKLGKSKKSDEVYKEIYRGPNISHQLKQVNYNSKITAMVTAVNLSGESTESDKVILFSAKGFFFKFDKKMKTDGLSLQNEDKTVVLNSLIHSFVLGDRMIKQGFHSWSIRIETVEEQNQMAVIGVGISKTKLNDPILGEDQFTYGLQIIQHPKINIRHTKHRYQLQMTSLEACNLNIVIEVHLDESWMNVFVNGSQLRMDSKTIGSPTFNDVHGEFYPAVSLYGSKVRLSIANTTDDN